MKSRERLVDYLVNIVLETQYKILPCYSSFDKKIKDLYMTYILIHQSFERFPVISYWLETENYYNVGSIRINNAVSIQQLCGSNVLIIQVKW